MNLFNLSKMYQFSINGKLAVIQATSMLDAMQTIENEGHTNYRFIKELKG